MWWILFICIIVNAYVVIVFKIFDQKNIAILPAIVVNYFVCVLTGLVVFRKPDSISEVIEAQWLPYAIFLGFIFISVFNLVGHTVKEFGVMVSTIFQKMSLLGPALIGILMYAENLTLGRFVGLTFAVTSIILISHPDRGIKWKESNLWLPLGTLLGSSILEITLYYVNIEKYADNADPVFVMTIFFSAGIIGGVVLLYQYTKKRFSFRKAEILGGIALGIPNFFSIYLVLVLLNQGWEGSSLFPINNVAVLFLTGLAGIYFFREKMDRLKLIGFFAAIISIVLIAVF